MPNTVTLINKQAELNKILESIRKADVLALDTEFERRTTFFPKPALLQIQLDSVSYLIDPLACPNLDELFKALSQTSILMHACREDLEVFRDMSAQSIDKFFDTQIAASLVGFDAQVSYQNLVYELLGVELSKTETCSDWLQRPLSEEQIHYAADDVIYLQQVNTVLLTKLEALDRLDWYEQEMRFLRSLVNPPADDEFFFKMKGLSRLNKEQLCGAYELVLWRDNLARAKNIPRGFIIKDKGLLQIIKAIGQKEINNNLFHRLEDVPPPFIRRYSADVCDLLTKLTKAQNTAKAEEAIAKLPQDFPDSAKQVKKDLKLSRDKLAEKLNIKAEVLLSNRLLDQVLDGIYFRCSASWSEKQSDDFFSDMLNPWRYDFFKTDLLSIKEQFSPS